MGDGLVDCARRGDVPGVLAALAAGAAVDERDAETERTALMEAAGSAAAGVEMVRVLIERGADVNAVVMDKPLFGTQEQADAFSAMMGEHSEVKEQVLAPLPEELRGFVAEKMGKLGEAKAAAVKENVLSVAVQSGNVGKVEALLEAGADVRYRSAHGYGALADAAIGDSPELVALMRLLIRRGADLNAASDWGESGLTVSARDGRFEAVRLLLEAGADAGVLEWTGLMRAVALGSVEEVREELAKGAELEARSRWSRTAFLLAVQTGDVEKAKALLEAGAHREARGRIGTGALALALEGRQEGMARWLLGEGFAVDAVDDSGRTALMEAASREDVAAMRILLEAGADVEKRDKAGQPVMKAAGTVEAARLLAEHGADLNDMERETRARFTGAPADGRIECTAEEYRRAKHPRFGRGNPERMEEPFWVAMIRGGANAYRAREKFEGGFNGPERPAVWSFDRFGQSINVLPDGRIVEIAGEHEDYYDPDFHIYNDVVVHHPDGRIEIFGYPEEVFPPTDFHTATLVGGYLYLVGSLGYMGRRRIGETQVYRLRVGTWEMERVETRGPGPGWISEHKARYDGAGKIEVWGGQVCEMKEGKEELVKNEGRWALEVETGTWAQVGAQNRNG
ncbi:MAG TPA: ankyrin repeat domain-containing protein [Phycisphaerae bacterium]|nr:ankyrin repeat domain-containing protein [Phycisphaerae bacterium]